MTAHGVPEKKRFSGLTTLYPPFLQRLGSGVSADSVYLQATHPMFHVEQNPPLWNAGSSRNTGGFCVEY